MSKSESESLVGVVAPTKAVAEVDYDRRRETAPNHSMTHVLNFALRKVHKGVNKSTDELLLNYCLIAGFRRRYRSKGITSFRRKIAVVFYEPWWSYFMLVVTLSSRLLQI